MAYALGFVLGLGLLAKGFLLFREYRLLADTPLIPTRSIPMGFVEIHGRATGTQLLQSPVGKTPCFFYKIDIEKWEKDKDIGHWSALTTRTSGVKFYLDDGTGKVLVNPVGAAFDLARTAGPSYSVGELTAYVSSLGFTSGEYRLTEYCILPDRSYDVTGTCVENPDPTDEHDRNMITKGEHETTFLISSKTEKELEKALLQRALLFIVGGALLTLSCLASLLLPPVRH